MEIKEYEELNALNKLLGKVKFQDDLDFNEFKEFVGSPIIASIFKRINEEYLEESVKRGYIDVSYAPKFEFESYAGRALMKRIDELSPNEKQTLMENNTIEDYLRIMLIPLSCDNGNFQQLLNYAKLKIIST